MGFLFPLPLPPLPPLAPLLLAPWLLPLATAIALAPWRPPPRPTFVYTPRPVAAPLARHTE
jgi:hypothetical protein